MSENHFYDLTAKSKQIIEQFTHWLKIAIDKFKDDLVVECSAFVSANLVFDKTYTKDEVASLFQSQLYIFQDLIDTQIKGIMAASTELVYALLREVDQERLVLQIDTITILNKGGVIDMIPHGRELLNGPARRLAPLTVQEAGGKVAQQLEDSNNQIRQLRRKLQQVTDAYTQMLNSRSDEAAKVLSIQDTTSGKDRVAVEPAQRCHDRDDDLQKTVQQLRLEVSEAKKELTQRLSQSTQYQQVKNLLAQRNVQLKWMREQLKRYDPLFEINEVDDIVIEED
ncbi:unnamed protein product [Phytomonas sp. EM1]|nr:unnamed protein product [Phytomonas sp. EM1]|eukprot:CCW61125.1 unnamed protein product [Phytomonas sp. isolate EM1]